MGRERRIEDGNPGRDHQWSFGHRHGHVYRPIRAPTTSVSMTPAPTVDRQRIAWRMQRVAYRVWWTLQRHERALWGFVLAALLVDFGLTVYGFQLGLVERNPLARDLLASYGIPGIAGLKLAALALAAGLRLPLPAEYGSIVPLALLLPWLYAVGVNVLLVTAALF